ncbi:MAG: gamma carbonic anhydrase family protein [Polyangiaceae bacterium]|nr:gamma carbonic anhydrase family protein [Polyangiaceae bacterium]
MGVYELQGVRPRLGRDVFIADSAAVIGDVSLGEEASVWFGAVLRADYRAIHIGARSNVQDNAVIHIATTRGPGAGGTVVGDDVVVGHAAVLHACTIGHRCLVGMGAIVLDGSSIGDESFVAAGSLVPPDTVVPPRSFLLGRPAKVIRAVTDAEAAAILESSTKYAGFARDFRAGCVRVT